MALTFPSRGLLKGDRFDIGVAPLYVAAHETAAPAGSHLPAGDSLAILHSIHARRVLDAKAAEAQVKEVAKKRKNSKVSSSENPSSSKRAASSRAASSTPFGLTSGQSQGTAAAPPATDATGAAVSYGRVVYTEESLSTKIQSDLKQICQKRSLPVSGKKKVLIDRILTGQLGTGS